MIIRTLAECKNRIQDEHSFTWIDDFNLLLIENDLQQIVSF